MDIEGQSAKSAPVEQTMFVPLLSALVPGTGDIWLWRLLPGLQVRGLCFLTATMLFLLIYTFGGLNHYYWAFWVARSWFLLNFSSAFLTHRSLYKSFHAGRLVLLFLVAAILGQGIVKGCVYLYGIRDYVVPSAGFQPTIFNGENIWCDESAVVRAKLRRGDVVTLRYKGSTYVKRLVGFGGDEVISIDGNLQVNGEPLNVPFKLIDQESDDAPRNFGPIRVPAGKIFVVGDNRDISLDSRNSEFGYPPQAGLRGKVFFVRESPDSKRNGMPIR